MRVKLEKVFFRFSGMRATSRLVTLVLTALCFTTGMMVMTLERSRSQLSSTWGPSRNLSVAKENCLAHDMVYWTHEDPMKSPYAPDTHQQRYVSFEYDQGAPLTWLS